jgi:hypothetical protein
MRVKPLDVTPGLATMTGGIAAMTLL